LRCVYCQNYQISQQVETIPTRVLSPAELADEMLSLEERGAHNINLVSPTHVIATVAEGLLLARRRGLSIPIVYNTNGYDALSTLQALEGLVNIYLPDIRYSDNRHAQAYSAVGDYVQVNRRAIREMYRQVGNLQFTPQGIACQGVLVRHLVLPQDVAGSQASLEFLASLSTQMYVSLMSQYAPHYRARSHPPLHRKITAVEYERVLDQALSLGLDNCFIQELESSDTLVPDFAQTEPFER
jgi:putative pyruvate formate lyase activating enzyme